MTSETERLCYQLYADPKSDRTDKAADYQFAQHIAEFAHEKNISVDEALASYERFVRIQNSGKRGVEFEITADARPR